MTEEVKELRTVYRIERYENVRVTMDTLKKGDYFMIFEPDGTRVGTIWKALDDGFVNDNGIGTVNSQPFEPLE